MPRAAEVSCSSAAMTGATAAMALPPQMAVPTLMSRPVSPLTPMRRASQMPRVRVKAMLTAVAPRPRSPALSTTPRFIPAPKPTTDHPRSGWIHRLKRS